MFKYENLKKDIKKKDLIQVVTPYFNGGIGQLGDLNENYIKIVPVNDEDHKEEYQSVTHEVLLPIEDLKVVIKVNTKEIIKDD